MISKAAFLPMVFLTGYRIQYGPNGTAEPLKSLSSRFHGIAVSYKGNNSTFIRDDGLPDGVVPFHYPAADFKADFL